MDTKLAEMRAQFEKALSKLEAVMRLEKNEVVRDSSIQRFEFTFDLAWKTLKTFLEEKEGIICKSPKDCIREAHKQGFVEYDDFWLDIVDMRNETAHMYKEELADKVYAMLPKVISKLRKLLENLV